MRRLAVVPLLLLAAALPGLGKSTAAPIAIDTPTLTPTVFPTVVVNGFCLGLPNTSPYLAANLCPTPAPTRPLVTPTKRIDLGGPIPSSAGVTTYPFTITSTLACFALDESINVYSLGSPAAITETDPLVQASHESSLTLPGVEPVTGRASLLLEIKDSSVGPAGVDLKAVWPKEGAERVVNVIPAAPPTVTVTPVPGSTATPTPVPTTPIPTATPTAIPTATPGPFSVRACVDPDVIRGQTLGGDSATLYGQTTPGAQCTASMSYYLNNGSFYASPRPDENFNGSLQTALSDGFVVYPWAPNTKADYGIGLVSCFFGVQSQTACTAFLIAQSQTVLDTNTDTSYLLTQRPHDTAAAIRADEERSCPSGTILTP